MIYGYFYRLLMRLSHRFNWHHMKPNPHLEHGKIHLWCHWCGIRSVKTNIEEVISIRKASEK
jgi:hypothetical protein